MSELERIYYRKHAVTLYKSGYHLRAFQVLFKNGRERKDLRSLLYLGWMILYGKGCCQSYKLSIRIFKEIMKKKETQEAREALKLLALVYRSGKIKYDKNFWTSWTLPETQTMDLFLEEGF